MTDNNLIPQKEDWPAWAVDCFIHDDQPVYKNKHGQVKHKNGHFVKGFSGNKAGTSSDHAKQILKVRSMCLDALEKKGLPRIIKELSNDELSARNLVAIVKFLSEQCIPKQIEDTSPEQSHIPQIIITSDAMQRAEELDRQYQEASEDARKAGY